MLGYPGVVAARVIADLIEYHLHAESMRGAHKLLEILNRTELRIYIFIILYSIIGSESTNPLRLRSDVP